jgi:hypothetical protein
MCCNLFTTSTDKSQAIFLNAETGISMTNAKGDLKMKLEVAEELYFKMKSEITSLV